MNGNNCIGVFDSGVGGISVLKELSRILPAEDFWFYGDSANAPYGEKTKEQVVKLSTDIVEHMIDRQVKAIVIACNTATSAAVLTLRETYPDLPIIGMEPAIKLAAATQPHSRILVMATPVTLGLEKYQVLSGKLEDRAEFIPIACAGLAQRIEQGNLEGEDLRELLESLLNPYVGQVDSVVLGCTHYPFIKGQIREIMGDIPFFDGGKGAARELKRRLEQKGLLRAGDHKGGITFYSSKNTREELELYQWFYNREI